jgi:uncharacterized membrane-anchored protein YitT (DUF2179 family)
MNTNGKNKKQTASFHFLSTILFAFAGNFLYALTVKLFLLPTGIATGGVTGIALAIHHLSGFSVFLFILIFNVIMLILGYFFLGRQFALTAVFSTFFYPLALGFLDWLLKDFMLTGDLLLCALFSGLGIGLSFSILIRAGVSAGGMDIPPLILNKCFKFPASVGFYLFDALILLAQAFLGGPEEILYGVLLVLIYSAVVNRMLFIGTSKIEVKIISEQSDDIREEILNQLDRGVTMLSGEGGYLHFSTQILMTVVSGRELPRVETLARSIDPECFMVIARVSEIRGRALHKEEE